MSADQAAVVATIRGNDRFVVATHENPDGDALGSMLATTLGLRALGKDASMYLTGTAALPAEYAFLQLDGLSRTLPDALGARVLFAVDCANERRIGETETGVEDAKLV